MQDHGKATELVAVAAELRDAVARLAFAPPVAHAYNPLDYAWPVHEAYLRRYGGAPKEVVLVGMNPGPWGMVQTGVPFGEVGAARGWLGLAGPVGRPADEHPKRPVTGFACSRSEVSGRRVWGWARDHWGTPERFFARFFVANYCPLAFLESGGRNRTPDKLPAAERERLFTVCDRALRRTVEVLAPCRVIGIGAFAEQRARTCLADLEVAVGRILHPSPASPAANRGWAEQATAELRAQGIAVPD